MDGLDWMDWMDWILLRSLVQLEHLAVLININDHAMFGCFTMKSVLWPNVPIIGGWAVLFTP